MKVLPYTRLWDSSYVSMCIFAVSKNSNSNCQLKWNHHWFQYLNNLLEHYLEPLKRETFLSNAEITALFGNIQEIVTFQRQFLQNLDEALELEPDFHKFDHSSQFKVGFFFFQATNYFVKDSAKSENFFLFQNVLFSLGSAFLYYVNHFKLYSSFCASHSKAQKVLHPSKLKFLMKNKTYDNHEIVKINQILFHRWRKSSTTRVSGC